MKTDNKVLACLDRSYFADHVADCAAWAARRMDAPLEFLHVLDRHSEIGSGEDHSGAIGFDAQQAPLAELSAKDETRSRDAREAGRIFLNRLRERAIAAGVAEPDVRQRQGNLAETLVEQEGAYVSSCSGGAASRPSRPSATSAATSSASCVRCTS